MKHLIHFLLYFATFGAFLSCQKAEPDYVPKPKAYPRMELPPQTYQLLEATHPYIFEYSKSAIILRDTFALAEPHWIYIYYPNLKANIQLTYKTVENDPKRLSAFINDAYKMAGKHSERAFSLEEQTIKTKSGRTATILKLTGNVPTYYQFYSTDSTKNYLRGALYFNVAGKSDSLQPAIDYLRADIEHLLNTLKWRNNQKQ